MLVFILPLLLAFVAVVAVLKLMRQSREFYDGLRRLEHLAKEAKTVRELLMLEEDVRMYDKRYSFSYHHSNKAGCVVAYIQGSIKGMRDTQRRQVETIDRVD